MTTDILQKKNEDVTKRQMAKSIHYFKKNPKMKEKKNKKKTLSTYLLHGQMPCIWGFQNVIRKKNKQWNVENIFWKKFVTSLRVMESVKKCELDFIVVETSTT